MCLSLFIWVGVDLSHFVSVVSFAFRRLSLESNLQSPQAPVSRPSRNQFELTMISAN